MARESCRFAVVDLFCGMGGFSCGASQAGADVVLAIDSWAAALDTHKLNHPNCRHVQMELGGDLNKMADFILSQIPKGAPWHLHASPPCQLLSSANRMNYNPTKGMRLVNWSLALIALCRPTTWSLEQVPAAAKFLQRRHIRCSIADASWYGVPQTRQRCFAGNGWSFPPPIVTTASKRPSIASALSYVAKEATHCRGNSNSRAIYRNGRHLGNRRLYQWEGFRSIHEPSYTLLGHGRRLQLYRKGRNGLPSFVRNLSPQEYLILQGFPSDYSFPASVSQRDRYKLIGNSLVPRLAFLILCSAQRQCQN